MKAQGILLSLLCLVLLLSACSSGQTPTDSSATSSSVSVSAPAASSSQSQSAPPPVSAPAQEPASLPIVASPITLKIFAAQTGYCTYDDWNQIACWAEMEKRTNVHINWTIIPSASLAERRNLSYVSGDLPDAYMGAGVTTLDIVRMAGEGSFLELDGLLAEHAPNFNAIMEKYPDIRDGLLAPDGKIYTLPKASVNLNQRYNRKFWINQKWMDQLGLSMPKTTEDFYQMLKAFRTKDPNGNGLEDEIPITCNADATEIINNIAGAWGFHNRGLQNPYVDIDETTGKVRFIPGDAKYREVMAFMNRLYAEGLLNQEIFTNTMQQLNADIDNQLVGVFLFNHPVPAGKYIDDFIGLTEPFEGPYGDKLVPAIYGTVQTAGAFVLTNTNPHPAETVRWIDYLYGDEGSELFFMGIKDKSYYVAENGELHYTEEITKNPNGLDMNAAMAPYTNWAGSNIPCLRQLKYVLDHGDGMALPVAVTESMSKYFPAEIWNQFWFTEEENTRLSAINSELDKYINQMKSEFIIGRTSLDTWDEYAATLKKLGSEEYAAFYQTAYDRSKS